MSFLTGQKDADLVILSKLDDKDLVSTCQTNQYARSLCSVEGFWINRIVQKYGKHVLEGKPDNVSFRDYYTSGKAKDYHICREITGVKHLSLLVIDDFYNPRDGIINGGFTRDIVMLKYLLLKIALTRQTSFSPRNYLEEEKLKKVIHQVVEELPDYRRESIDPDSDYLVPREKVTFLALINLPYLERPDILRSASRNRPDMMKAFEKPEVTFKLVTHIHKGFMTGKIPLDILWDELCFNDYVRNFHL